MTPHLQVIKNAVDIEKKLYLYTIVPIPPVYSLFPNVPLTKENYGDEVELVKLWKRWNFVKPIQEFRIHAVLAVNPYVRIVFQGNVAPIKGTVK
jgi:hypothetical protein